MQLLGGGIEQIWHSAKHHQNRDWHQRLNFVSELKIKEYHCQTREQESIIHHFGQDQPASIDHDASFEK